MLRRAAAAFAALLALSLLAAASAGASAPGPRRCPAADLRYGIQDGMPKDFGVFRLTVLGGSCRTARHVARAFQLKLLQSPTGRVPSRVAGFAVLQLPPNAAQTYRLRATRGATVIRFDEVVPNG